MVVTRVFRAHDPEVASKTPHPSEPISSLIGLWLHKKLSFKAPANMTRIRESKNKILIEIFYKLNQFQIHYFAYAYERHMSYM